jgi:predicted Zn-dependent protease
LIRGELLEANDDLANAISEYEQAVSLRPDDYVLWLVLARAQEMNGNRDQAIAAARLAIPLAPFYAQPHWQLGNILLRAGQTDEAFSELSRAAASSPSLQPALMDLAWQFTKGDGPSIIRLVNPQTPESFRALAVFLGKRGAFADAMAMFKAAGDDAEGLKARRQFVAELISQAKFNDAYRVWTMNHAGTSDVSAPKLSDPGFEQESDLEDPGFGWRVEKKVPSINFSLDNNAAKEGQSSLKVDFSGEADPGSPIISQLVLVKPKTPYRLRFFVRQQDIVSGGLPEIMVLDARTHGSVAETQPFQRTSNGWNEITLDFISTDTEAVQISLQRERCASPCPIFGHLWLDDFSLTAR